MRSYTYRTTITIGDTNCFRNAYFTTSFKITGAARELWVKDCVADFDKHFASGLMLITGSATCDYKRDFFLFDPVRCEMTIQKLRQASAELVFRLYHDVTDECHAEARHKITFADHHHKICRMPASFRDAALAIEESS